MDAPHTPGWYGSVYGAEDTAAADKPHGWIQWKGTDVCMDVYCECGYHGHIHGYFFYAYECVACGKRYAVGQVVNLIPLTAEQQRQFEEPNTFKRDDGDH